jgi:hypothetical protein
MRSREGLRLGVRDCERGMNCRWVALDMMDLRAHRI